MNKYIRIYAFLIAVFALGCNNEQAEPQPGPDPGSLLLSVIQDDIDGVPVVVAGNPGANFIVSYQRELDGTVLDFEAINGALPLIMEDSEGTQWDIFGYGVSGPREGQALEMTHSFMGYWFVFASMYPGIELYAAPPEDAEIEFPPDEEWLIPRQYVFQASATDAIQSVDNPQFIEYRERDFQDGGFYVEPEDLVVGHMYDGEVRAYPHPVLDWHEIVNDEINGKPVAVVYCPLTGTGTIWDRRTSAGITTFGVSGLLYNNNILPYDRNTGSIWTQIDEECVNGDLMGEQAVRLRSVETTWETWISMFFSSEVMTTETGFGKPYGDYPYGDFKTNHELIPYPLTYVDDRVANKERVHCIIVNGKAKVYRFTHF